VALLEEQVGLAIMVQGARVALLQQHKMVLLGALEE
jgi:hypothetical protein